MTKEEYYVDKTCLFCGKQAVGGTAISFQDIRKEVEADEGWVRRSLLKVVHFCQDHGTQPVFLWASGTVEVGGSDGVPAERSTIASEYTP